MCYGNHSYQRRAAARAARRVTTGLAPAVNGKRYVIVISRVSAQCHFGVSGWLPVERQQSALMHCRQRLAPRRSDDDDGLAGAISLSNV